MPPQRMPRCQATTTSVLVIGAFLNKKGEGQPGKCAPIISKHPQTRIILKESATHRLVTTVSPAWVARLYGSEQSPALVVEASRMRFHDSILNYTQALFCWPSVALSAVLLKPILCSSQCRDSGAVSQIRCHRIPVSI